MDPYSSGVVSIERGPDRDRPQTEEHQMDDDRDLRDRLVAMESRIEASAPPEIASRRTRRLALSFAAAPILMLALAGSVVAGALVVGQGHGYPGVENPGQPLYGAQLECMTPPQAAAVIAAHGITKVVWQVERDAATAPGAVKPGSISVQQPTAPETGLVVPGSIVDGTLLMVVDQRRGAPAAGACGAR
jgi:hypothetical protein